MSDNFKIGCLALLIAIPIIIGLFFLESWFIMLLWNAIIPVIMWCQPLTYWHAVGLNLLITFLFGRSNSGLGEIVSKIFDD